MKPLPALPALPLPRPETPVAAARTLRTPSLLALLLGYAPGMLALAVLGGLASGALFAGALVAIDSALRKGSAGLDGILVVPALAYVLLVSISSMASASLSARLLLGQINALRLRLVHRLLEARLPALEAMGPARAVALLVDEVQRVAQGVGALPVLLLNLGICGAALAYVGWMSPPMLVLMAAALALGLAAVGWMFTRFLPMTNAAASQRQQLIDQLQTLAGQFKELKQGQVRRQAFVEQLLQPTLARVERRALDVQHLIAAMDTGVKAVFLLVLLALVALGVVALALPMVQLQTAVLAFMFIITPFSAVLESAQKLAESRLAWQRVHALSLEPEAAGQSQPVTVRERIELQGASYRYPQAEGVRSIGVQDVHLSLGRGQIVALRGGNGSGKTTVAKLLCGLYAPEVGALCCDGRPVADAERAAYRENVVAVWTGNESTLHWFEPTGQVEGLRWWAGFGLQAVQPYESGWVDCARLSSGQRARAALVSALTLARPFLVLDEWAANQDVEQRQRFYGELLPRLRAQGVGVLLIAHDAQATAVADCVVELHHADTALAEGGAAGARALEDCQR